MGFAGLLVLKAQAAHPGNSQGFADGTRDDRLNVLNRVIGRRRLKKGVESLIRRRLISSH